MLNKVKSAFGGKKTFLLIAFAALTLIGKGQITLEHTYTYAELYPIGSSGFKYIDWWSTPNQMNLYNLNHSIYKTFSIPTFSNETVWLILYVTENLFDSDGAIEYLMAGYDTSNGINNVVNYIRILKEDGTVLFYKDSTQLFEQSMPNIYTWGIIPTDSGIKMMLSNYNNTVEVYSLPGILPSGWLKEPIGSNNANLSYPFPNPSSNSTRVEYKLPNGVRSGEVIFYNLNGTEVKRYKVDNTFDSLSLNNSDLTSGTYFYHLITPNGVSSPKKMIVIK